MAGNDDPVDIQALAIQMLGGNDEDVEYEDEDDNASDDSGYDYQGHPAWRSILDLVPEENRAQVQQQLADWDAGVSRRFQSIHDEYEPYKRLGEYDPDTLKTAAEVYEQLLNDPRSTWETIGRVYGLSQIESDDEDEEDDLSELPASVRRQLSKLDEHDRVLASMAAEIQQNRVLEQEAQEDAELEEYLEELAEEYGDFDEDYVVGLIAAGVDGEEAVARFQAMFQYEDDEEQQDYRQYAPRVMSGSGGIPSSGVPNVTKLGKQDTQDLVAEILRLAATE